MLNYGYSKKLLLSTLLFSIIILWGCQEKINEEIAEVTSSEILNIGTKSNILIPYADLNTLESFAKDRELIDYSFARRLALIELQNSDFTTEMNWQGFSISKRPVIIYGFDSKPKSYEFFMKDAEGIEKGSVKVSARRNAPDILEEVSNTVRDYGILYSKASPNMKVVSDWTGELYIGLIGKSGHNVSSVINTKTGAPVEEELRELSEPEIYEKIAQNIESLTPEFHLNYESFENAKAAEEIKKYEIKGGLQEQMNALKQEIEKEQEAREKYWNIVAECRDSIMTLSDTEIKEIYSKNWWSDKWKKLVGVTKSSKYELANFKNNLKYRQGLSDWCGPWSLGWIYYSETKQDRYSEFEDYYSKTLKGIFGGKPMTPLGMWKAARAKGNGRMHVTPFFSKTSKDAYHFIKQAKQPIIILRGVSHYCVAYGCYKKQHGLWWTNYYFAVNDNEHEIQDKSKIIYRRSSWIAMLFIKSYIYHYNNYKQRPKVEPMRRDSDDRRYNSPYRRPSPTFRNIPISRESEMSGAM